MARPKSEEKRATLLAVAAQVFAKNGLTASTASITSAAGMSEGTLFNYFKSKEDLINTLYMEIKTELAEAMLEGFQAEMPVREQTRHIWNGYVDWGVKNPERLSVLHKLKVWDGVCPEVRQATAARYCDLRNVTEKAISDGVFQDVPGDFAIAMLSAQAETTMQFMRQFPADAEKFRAKGFEIFWNGLSRKE